LIHYSSTSGRWKLFENEQQEQAFAVKGGLLWFHHVLIAAVEVSKSYQVCPVVTSVSYIKSVNRSDTLVLARLGAQQSKYLASRGDLFVGRDLVLGGQLVTCIHGGQHIVPFLDSSNGRNHQATSVW
jgi:hypothetical protein